MRNKYKSSDKLWSLKYGIDGWYYEIRLKGRVIDQLTLSQETKRFLENEGVI